VKPLTFLPVLLLAIFARPTFSDTVELAGGGKLLGTVEIVTLLVDGKEKTFEQGEFTGVVLGKHGVDQIKLLDGRATVGTFVSLRIRSVGGLLTFGRDDVAAVDATDTRMRELKKQYELKRGKIEKNDTAALYALAVWCRENGLEEEARNLAGQILGLKPEPELAVRAHKMLGHVLVDGKWSEPPKPKEPEEPEDEDEPGFPDFDKPDDTGPFDDDAQWDDSEEPTEEAEPNETASEAIKLCKELHGEYSRKAEEARADDYDAVKRAFQTTYDRVRTELVQLKKDIPRAEEQKQRIRDDLREEKRRRNRNEDRINRLEDDYDEILDDLAKMNNSYTNAINTYRVLAATVKAAKAQVRERAFARQQKVNVAKYKIERFLRAGKTLSEQDMRAIFEGSSGN